MLNHALSTGLVSLFAAVAAAQTTLYVDGSTSGPGTGTNNDPFPTISRALEHAVADDTVLVAPGLYVENLVVPVRVNVRSSDGPLTTSIFPGDFSPDTVLVENSWPLRPFFEGRFPIQP